MGNLTVQLNAQILRLDEDIREDYRHDTFQTGQKGNIGPHTCIEHRVPADAIEEALQGSYMQAEQINISLHHCQ